MVDELRTPAIAPGSAMQRAVAAEQHAREAIAEAEAQGRARVEQARARAREMLDEAPNRIARLRERRNRTVRQAIARIAADEAAAMRELQSTAVAPERLEANLARLLRQLTGADDTEAA